MLFKQAILYGQNTVESSAVVIIEWYLNDFCGVKDEVNNVFRFNSCDV